MKIVVVNKEKILLFNICGFIYIKLLLYKFVNFIVNGNGNCNLVLVYGIFIK